MTRLPPLIVDHHAEFTAWRRDIHAHPELGFAESRTAALVAERRESCGIEVHRGERPQRGVAQAMGATATPDFRVNFAPKLNDPQQAEFAASVCAEPVGADRVERDPALIMASEDFSFMLERVPGCFLNIGNGEGEEGCEVHDPAYDFNDAAIPFGVGFFVRAAERKLAPDAAAR